MIPEMNRWFLRQFKGESLLAWAKRTIKYRLEHNRWRTVVVNRETGETARWYPDHAGGSLHHEDWWALVKPHELDGLEDRFASDERGVHICKHPVYNAKWHREHPRLDMRWNPLSNEPDISIPCGICRSYSCCRPKEHGITAIYEAVRS